jgi:hypothetical protein
VIIKQSNSITWLAELEKHLASVKQAVKMRDHARAVRAGRELAATAQFVEDELLREFHLANSVKLEYANSSESGL